MLKEIFFGLALTSFVITMQGCTNSSNSSVSTSGRNYQGAGSRWTISLSDTNFTMNKYDSISDTTANLTLSGTVAKNSDNQFLTLTVTSSSDISEVALNTVVNALEISNTGVFIKTPGNPTPLVAVISGSCPTSDINSNWVITKPRLDSGVFPQNSFDDDGAGTVAYSSTAETFLVTPAGVVNRQFDVTGSSPHNMSGQLCSDGRLAATLQIGPGQSDVFDMYFTSSGFQIVKFPSAAGDQIIFGLPKQSTNVTGAAIAGTYSVLIYEGGAAADLSAATLSPGQMIIANDGSATIRKITDVANNTLAGADAYAISNFSTTFTSNGSAVDSKGLFHGQFGAGQKVTCATANTNGAKVISCYGFVEPVSDKVPVTIIGHSR